MSGFIQFPPCGPRVPNIQQVSAFTAVGGTPGATTTIPYVAVGGPLVLYGLSATSTSTFTSRIFLTWEQAYCDTGPIPNALLWGTAQDVTWVRPKFIPANATINFEVADTSGADNTIKLTLHCANALPGDGPSTTDPYGGLYGKGKGFMVYSVPNNTPIAIPANGNIQSNIRIEDWADFAPDAMVSSQTSASMAVQITYRDTRADYTYSMSNIRVPQASLFGTQAKPYLFPVNPCGDSMAPIFRRSSNLLIDPADTSGFTNNFTPVFIGQRMT